MSGHLGGTSRPAGLEGLPEVEPRRRGARRWVAPVVAAAVLLVVAATVARPVAGIPGDPTSTTYGGLRGILDVAGSLGRRVDISVELPVDGTTTYLVVRDDLTPDERDAVRAWVDAGGRLVVADPASPLVAAEVEGGLVTDVLGATSFAAGCDLLPGVDRIRSSSWTALAPTTDDAELCVRLGERGAWLVRQPTGVGEVIALGGPGPLANEHLQADDNALAGVQLLAPDAGDRLLVRPLPAPGSGEEGLTTLVPRRVRHLLVALALVYGVLVWWRARRLGPPVDEPLPLRVPGAAIVDGVAGLLQRTGDRDGVAAALREELRVDLQQALGVTPGSSDDALARLAHARLDVDGEALSAALTSPVATDEDLLVLARRCAGLHRILAARRTSSAVPGLGPRLHRPDDDRGAQR